MKRLTLRTENQWRSLKDGGSVDLLRASFHASGWMIGCALTVAGFGFGASFWLVHVDWPTHTDISPSRTYAWEPIETDGWAGVPEQGVESGMEKAP